MIYGVYDLWGIPSRFFETLIEEGRREGGKGGRMDFAFFSDSCIGMLRLP